MGNLNQCSAEEYWKSWLDRTDPGKFDDDSMYLEKSVYDLVKLAVDNEQYFEDSEFKPVKRVVKFRINLPRSAMKKTLGIDTLSIYGMGLFTLVEGIFLSSSTRSATGYDTTGRKRYFDLSSIPSDIKEEYEFSLTIPAINGLFVPKKSSLTRWMSSVNQIQYFDLNINI